MKKKSKKNAPYHLLMYVLNSEPKIKRFDTTEEMGKFIDKFNKKYPEAQASNSGNWTDYAITNILGDVHFFTDGIEVE
jgi:hypothetical protein